MNTKIYKYKFEHRLELPKGAKVLNVLYSDFLKNWYIYVLCDPDAELETREFQSVETGGVLIEDNLLMKPTYITSTISHDDRYVLHLFENVKI